MEDCSVERVVTDEVPHSQIVPKVTHIITSLGTLHCEYFVNASGMVSFKLKLKLQELFKGMQCFFDMSCFFNLTLLTFFMLKVT